MKAKIFSNDFNRVIAATKDFTSLNDVRKRYNYIRLEFSAADSQMTAVAVDGYRMSVEHTVCECDEDFVAYLNRNTHLPHGMDATIEVCGNDTIIRCGDCIMGCSCKEMSGEFLDWEKVIPIKEPSFRIGVNGNYLLAALKAAKVSVGNRFKNPVVLEFWRNDEPIVIRTNKEDIKMVLPVRIKEKNHEAL